MRAFTEVTGPNNRAFSGIKKACLRTLECALGLYIAFMVIAAVLFGFLFVVGPPIAALLWLALHVGPIFD